MLTDCSGADLGGRGRARSFWGAVVCNSLLCIVKQTGERSLALYLHDDLQLSTSAAASLASVWPIGFVVSVLCFGALFDKARCPPPPAPRRSLCAPLPTSQWCWGTTVVPWAKCGWCLE